ARAFTTTAAILLLSTFAAAASTLTGTVKNATTGKPAAGDEVVLLKLGQGMEEAGRTKADSKGKFSFSLDDAPSPHLVRVIHQEVTYHRMAPPGTTSVEIEVYDVAKKLDKGINVVVDIMRMQATQGQIEVLREIDVQNTSSPPRTQMNERNLEFYLPEGAHIVEDSATATTENGNPLKSAPVPEGEKNRYSFVFPLRPGFTRFEVGYLLPYTGSANLDPKSLYPLEHFAVMLPKTMQFAAATSAFKLMSYPPQPDANMQVASNTALGQNLAFRVSGEGLLNERQEGGGAPGESAQTAPPDNGARPGGGLGPPIDAPDPLQKYRWYILGGFAAVLVAGGIFVASRQQSAHRAAIRSKGAVNSSLSDESDPNFRDADYQENDSQFADAPPANLRRSAAPSSSRSSMLLEGLKEELFQLEVDRKQNKISPSEYERAKAALDHTLERALKREAQKA
ncbi:MAG: carboxypeptidase regulatory-like domain-containing protein, partial [Candidatus Sulfotelmatobacter sp.]